MDNQPDDGTGPPVMRSEFSTTDSDVAEEFLDAGYINANKLTITGIAEDFTFTHSAVTTPAVSVNRVQIGVDFTDDACVGPDDPITAIHVLGGRLTYLDTAYPEVHAGIDDVLMLPLTGPVRGIGDCFDLAVVQLDRSSVVAYAAATAGIDPARLTFDDITPVTPSLGRYWVDSLTRVRDVLTDPWASASPILVGQVFGSLAAALLSVFPNSALARVTDPEAPPVRGKVSAARLREVVEFLDAHADRPIDPVTIADLAGMPTAEIVEGLRRRGLHPALLLWRARLRGVRDDLLDADPAREEVRAVAARWGFAHLGRFRIAYRREYNETPEQTHQR